MEKPKKYSIYRNRHKPIYQNITFTQEEIEECLKYNRWVKSIKIHPEWKNLSYDEWEKVQKEYKKSVHNKCAEKMRSKMKTKSSEEIKEINKRKGSFYNNKTKEEKEKYNEELRNRSQNFWNNMTDEQRKEFGQYRWNLKSDDEKEKIIQQFLDGNKQWRNNLSEEDINNQIQKMNDARIKKLEEDEEFRLQQIELLRLHNKEFFDSMTEEERREFYKSNGRRLGDYWKNRWDSDPEFREKQTKVLRKHCSDYIDSLSKEELDKKMKELNKLAVEKTKYLWNNDPEFREKQTNRSITTFNNYFNSLNEEEIKNHYKKMNDARIEYFKNIDSKELYTIMHHNNFNRKFEEMFNNSFINNDYYIISEYSINIKNYIKIWDYGIFDKQTNTLQMVVDLDGAYFHADNCDYNDMQSREITDERRWEFIPKNVKSFIIQENNLKKCFELMIKQLIMNYDEYIQSIFNTCRMMPFPYLKYTSNELINSMNQLIKLKCDDKYHKSLSLRNREGDRIINHFHESIYRANRKGKPSPYEAWYNDDLLMKCINNRVIYQSYLNPNKILQGFNISKIAPKVSVFSAGRAKMIINKYLNQYDEIFDPFSGFSGRMLGAISLNKRYIGSDINEIHVKESNELINHFGLSSIVTCRDIMSYNNESYETLFTCPPYNDKEIWIDHYNDINKTCDEWIDICLERFKCNRYVFIVDNTIKYQNYIQDVIINKSHFGKNNEYVIIIDK